MLVKLSDLHSADRFRSILEASSSHLMELAEAGLRACVRPGSASFPLQGLFHAISELANA
jgi:hypothetical protein